MVNLSCLLNGLLFCLISFQWFMFWSFVLPFYSTLTNKWWVIMIMITTPWAIKRCHFYFWTFKFHKVVRQHNSGVVVDFTLLYSTVYLRIQKWKNYWNRPTFAKVIVKIKVAPFYGPRCMMMMMMMMMMMSHSNLSPGHRWLASSTPCCPSSCGHSRVWSENTHLHWTSSSEHKYGKKVKRVKAVDLYSASLWTP